MSSSSEEVSRDWSELPPELIERIAGTLDSIPDYVIFGAVCTSWRSAARSIGPSSIRQPPWLYSVDSSADYSSDLRLQLHNPWKPPGTPETYTFPISVNGIQVPCCIIRGSACGYLLVLTEQGLALFNPLLSDWLTLPRLPSVRHGNFFDRVYPQIVKYDNDTISVIVASIQGCIPYCWRSGDPSSWTKLCDYSVQQFTFHKGSFYLVDSTDQMVVVDASNFTVTSRFPISNVNPRYLVESSSGVLLMVTEPYMYYYQVMQLDLSQQPPTFVKLDSIGEDALFVTSCHNVICFPVAKSKGLKKNCIYYNNGRRGEQFHFYSLDIGNGIIRSEPFVHEEAHSWLIPALSFHP